MIEQLEVRNWQSIRQVSLDLGRLSVIVGPSSSGKTALMRAIRALASNLRGSAAITRGQKVCAITARTGEAQITLERSDTAGCYRLVDLTAGQERVFTKLAGSVPEAITAALGIDPVPTGGSSLHFAGQFDRPFLLDDSGATVARVLGELTNVTRLFDAVREANRRRNAHAAALRIREADLADLHAKATTFATFLPRQLRLADQAEQHAEAANQLQDRTSRLRAALSTLDIAEAALARAVLPTLPTDTAVLHAQARLVAFQTLISAWSAANQATARAANAVAETVAAETAAQHQLHAALQAAGTCPTCGRTTA